MAKEFNFDGLVGPTHNYSGLSYGNIASTKSKHSLSNPKEAALQGLQKMKFLADMGIPQAILPPHERPLIYILRELGFRGTDKDILHAAYHQIPSILYACSSAASMWTANAATISPSADTSDGKLHITPANLTSKFHRSIEAPWTHHLLKKIFHNPSLFVVHEPLPQGSYFADEGAANHNRFCKEYAQNGIELFVWGRHSFQFDKNHPQKFPARQTFEASQAIVRNHRLDSQRVIFGQQNPLTIDAGVFHNDVISVGNENVYLYHEDTFTDTPKVIHQLKNCLEDLILIKVPRNRIPVKIAVAAYLFNSQIVSLPDKTMRFIAPMECRNTSSVFRFIQELVEDPSNPIAGVDFLNLHQSMANGGGPACLRLRIVLTDQEKAAIPQSIIFTNDLYHRLKHWVEKYYRDRLLPEDFADVQFLQETRAALDELSKILLLGSIYPFQREEKLT